MTTKTAHSMSTAPLINVEGYDYFVVNVSGGKDSSVLMLWASLNLPKDRTLYTHQIIDIDWHETIPTVVAQAKHFGLHINMLQAKHADGTPKGFISKLTSPKRTRAGDIVEQMFPGPSTRWCTSELKSGPADIFINALSKLPENKGKHLRVLNIMGERWQEGECGGERADLEAFRPRSQNSLRTVTDFSPLLPMTQDEVWQHIRANKIPTHPCYELGVQRASCAICIFSSNSDIAVAAIHAPDIVAKYVQAERTIKHTFRYVPATKKREEKRITIEDILRTTDTIKHVQAFL